MPSIYSAHSRFSPGKCGTNLKNGHFVYRLFTFEANFRYFLTTKHSKKQNISPVIFLVNIYYFYYSFLLFFLLLDAEISTPCAKFGTPCAKFGTPPCGIWYTTVRNLVHHRAEIGYTCFAKSQNNECKL